jgi:SAM-dependent methyltransferase
MTSRLIRWFDRRWYPQFSDNWDDEIFRARILESLRPNHLLLDLGAGAGLVRQMNFRGMAAHVTGLDLDPRVKSNPYLNTGIVGDASKLPFADGSFDIVISDNVLEHLREPIHAIREVHRVLRPGGLFLAKTPNRWHYVATASRLTPTRFHQWFNSIRGRPPADTFPTLYRANSRRQLAALADAAGFGDLQLEYVEGRPEYLRVNALTYLFGVAYERTVNCTDALSGLRVILIATLRKA